MTPKGFTCTECGDCCKNFSQNNRVLLFPSDMKRISEKFELSIEDFQNEFTYFEKHKIEGKNLTLFYLKDTNGNCNFLVENKCSIHSFKPAQCHYGPYNMFWDGQERWDCMIGIKVSKNHNTDEIDTKFISEYLNQ